MLFTYIFLLSLLQKYLIFLEFKGQYHILAYKERFMNLHLPMQRPAYRANGRPPLILSCNIDTEICYFQTRLAFSYCDAKLCPIYIYTFFVFIWHSSITREGIWWVNVLHIVRDRNPKSDAILLHFEISFCL
jgi:hypothetical protein